MIHLDTNVLVALPALVAQRHEIVRRIRDGEPAGVSAVVWFEFCCGPASEQQRRAVMTVIQGNVIALDEDVAERAAVLFNGVGRPRRLRTDSLIAATALAAEAELITYNASDFAVFAAHGLRLIKL